MARDYKLVSGDGHVNEPKNMYADYMSAKFKERAPHMDKFDKGDAWIFDWVPTPVNFGLNAVAGVIDGCPTTSTGLRA